MYPPQKHVKTHLQHKTLGNNFKSLRIISEEDKSKC